MVNDQPSPFPLSPACKPRETAGRGEGCPVYTSPAHYTNANLHRGTGWGSALATCRLCDLRLVACRTPLGGA